MDNMIIRLEGTYRRANHEGGMVFNALALTYLLIRVVGVKTDELDVFLNDFNGAPSSNEDHRRFLELLRRHLQRKESSSEGRAPLNFAGWDENEVWLHCGSTMRKRRGADKAQMSSIMSKKKKKQLIGTKKITRTHA
eukprot:733489-Amphidinium_carterae.1